jgi:hypothetical protein
MAYSLIWEIYFIMTASIIFYQYYFACSLDIRFDHANRECGKIISDRIETRQ